jgi:aminoglycoside 6-adenylyltransferase
VAKAVWRDELPLAKYTFDVILMNGLITLLSWQIGLRYDWNVNIGKHGKWLKTFLPENLYARLVTLYPTVDYEEIWQSLSNFGNFACEIGTEVAEKLGYNYPMQEDINVTEYIQKIKVLPNKIL